MLAKICLQDYPSNNPKFYTQALLNSPKSQTNIFVEQCSMICYPKVFSMRSSQVQCSKQI